MKQNIYNLEQIIDHFHHIKSLLLAPETETENNQLIELARDLKKATKTGQKDAAALLPLILKNIEAYEKRTHLIPRTKPNEILSFLMDEHQLTQHDFPEIGSQSLISKILSGERKLTARHIERLSIRFNLSPSLFFD